MKNVLLITIEGHDLDSTHEGDWTVSIHVSGQLSAQCGLSGAPIHAIAAAHDLAVENGFVEEASDD